MKRDFIFVFILLAILSMVNAIPHQLHKRDTTFVQCPKTDENVASLLTVIVSPDPPVAGQTATYTISGELAKAAPLGSELRIGFFDLEAKLIGVPTITDLCSKVECPTSSISIVEQVTIPAALPDAYASAVLIIDLDKIRYGCAVAAVGGNGGTGADPNALN